MTPKEARDLYDETYRAERLKLCGQWSKPVIQEELSLKAWEVVIKAINQENDLRLVDAYLKQSECEG